MKRPIANRTQVTNLPHKNASDIRLSSLPPIGRGQPLALIAGPCVIESEEHVHFLAAEIRKIAGAFIFKASFDKANRRSIASYRRPGFHQALRILTRLPPPASPLLTAIHY